jgi:hypothetical protein
MIDGSGIVPMLQNSLLGRQRVKGRTADRFLAPIQTTHFSAIDAVKEYKVTQTI